MFKIFKKKTDGEFGQYDKNLLGIKVTKAQQNPEPIYDLSHCSAELLPDDTYTYCKLLGKTTLLINNNLLTNLHSGGSIKDLSSVTSLNASANKLEKLPSNFDSLQALTTLDLSQNLLKSLPDSFGDLYCLKELNLAQNKFKKFPSCLCTLRAIKSIDMKNNKIKSIPQNFQQLKKTLISFEADFQNFIFPKTDVCVSLQSIMEYLCDASNTQYAPILDTDIQDSPSFTQETETMKEEYLNKNMTEICGNNKAAYYLDPKLEEAQREQIEAVLRNTSENREQLLTGLLARDDYGPNYETQKHEKKKDHVLLEQQLKLEQEKELTAYLDTAQNKESILQTISSDETNFRKEVGSIVAAKDQEREWFVSQLSNAEQNIELALNEIVQGSKKSKSDDLITLVEEQEIEMSKLLDEHVDTSTELHRKDIMHEMEKTFSEALIFECRSQGIEEKHSSLMEMLDTSVKAELDHIQELIESKSLNQVQLVSDLLRDEKHQAEAFKILLMKNDLKRNEVVRQISLIEHELMRLSSVELARKKCGVMDSTHVTESQRKTLVELLCSLLKDKENRDNELETWFLELTKKRDATLSNEDFWLCQYQHLMSIKPPALDKAEQMIDEEVKEILYSSLATDLLPLFARKEINFATLLKMSSEDFENIGVGVATYQSIQRSLQTYLQRKKCTGQEPQGNSNLPSAPDEAQAVDSLATPSAPCDDSYLETECVICLNNEPCVIFMNCGHVCTCDTCCVSLTSCPLCRAQIITKCLFNKV